MKTINKQSHFWEICPRNKTMTEVKLRIGYKVFQNIAGHHREWFETYCRKFKNICTDKYKS